jgi:hypothetical protein
MGKRAEDMTPEELEARRARMTELREMATKKKKELAAERAQTEGALKEAEREERERKRELAAVKRGNVRLIAEQIDANKMVVVKKTKEGGKKMVVVESDDEEPAPIKEPAPTMATSKVPHVLSSPDAFQLLAMMTDMKAQLKTKYKEKYATKYQAPPPPTPMPPPPPRANPVKNAAKEALSNKVQEEISRMAYKSLFGTDM